MNGHPGATVLLSCYKQTLRSRRARFLFTGGKAAGLQLTIFVTIISVFVDLSHGTCLMWLSLSDHTINTVHMVDPISMENLIPMEDPIPMVDPIPTVNSIPMVDLIPMVGTP